MFMFAASTNLYITSLIILAGFLLYFGLYLIFGKIPRNLNSSSYSYSRHFLGAAYTVLALSIIVYFSTRMYSMEVKYRIALNISSYYIAIKLFTLSFITLIDRTPDLHSTKSRIKLALLLIFPFFVWSTVLIKDSQAVNHLQQVAAAILFISLIIDVVFFFRKYRSVVAQGEYYYANGIKKHISWMMKSVYCMIGAGVFCAGIALYSSSMLKSILFLYTAYFVGVCIYTFNNMLYFMATFSELTEMSNSKTLPGIDINKINLDPDRYKQIHQKVLEWVETKRFCQKKISILTVANEVSTNRLYLSNYINSTYNCTFRVWLSKLRIEEAKKLLFKNPNTTITQIADQVGFQSSTTLTHIFTQSEGVSPKEWAKRHAHYKAQ